MAHSFVVKLDVRDRGSYLSALCGDVPGLHGAGKTAEALRTSAMRAIKDLYKRNQGKDVDVLPMDELDQLQIRFH